MLNMYKKSNYPNPNPTWKLDFEFESRSDLNKDPLFESKLTLTALNFYPI